MSKGPGRIQRAIADAFDRDPDNALTIEDICTHAYPGINRVEKKHRVAVIRAVRTLALGDHCFSLRMTRKVGAPLILCRTYSVLSRAMANMKGDRLWAYQSKRGNRYQPPATEDYFRKLLAPGGRYYDRWVKPGGIIWRKVEIEIAKRDGNETRARELEAQTETEFQAWLKEGRAIAAVLRFRRDR